MIDFEWLRHDDQDVAAVLDVAYAYIVYGSAAPLHDALRGLSSQDVESSLREIANDLHEADAVEAVSSRDEFEELTGIHSRSASWTDDVDHHVTVIRDGARVQAEMLVQRARDAKRLTDAIDVVARRLLHKAWADLDIDFSAFSWIGYDDWTDILARVNKLAPPVPADEYLRAARFLEERAEK